MTDPPNARDDELRHLLRLVRGEPVPEDQDEDLGDSARTFAHMFRAANNGVAAIEKLTLLAQDLPGESNAMLRALLAGEPNPTRAAAAERFRAIGLRELRTRPKPSYTVDLLLQADSVAVLEGVDGTYKSFLALAWAHSVALGRPWLGRPVQQGRVLYLLGEGSRGLPKRADAWQIVNLGGRQDLDDVLGFVVDEMPQLWKGDASAVLAANPGHFTLVIVDTLARALVGGNENLQQDMGLLVAGCEELRRGTGGATVLILHHLNNTGGTRGSTSLPGAVSTRLRLERQGTTRLVTLQTKKQRDDETESPIALVARTVELGTFDDQGRAETSLVLDLGDTPTATEAPEKLTPSCSTALEALVRAGTIGAAAWQDAAGQHQATFYRARRHLVVCGYVEHLQDGTYCATTAGKQRSTAGPTAVPLLSPGAGGAGPIPALNICSVSDTAEIELSGAGGAKTTITENLAPGQQGSAGHSHTLSKRERPAPGRHPLTGSPAPDSEDLPWQ